MATFDLNNIISNKELLQNKLGQLKGAVNTQSQEQAFLLQLDDLLDPPVLERPLARSSKNKRARHKDPSTRNSMDKDRSLKDTLNHRLSKHIDQHQIDPLINKNPEQSLNLCLPKIRPSMTQLKWGNQALTPSDTVLGAWFKQLKFKMKRYLNWPVAKITRVFSAFKKPVLQHLPMEDVQDPVEQKLDELYRQAQKKACDNPEQPTPITEIDSDFEAAHQKYLECKPHLLANSMRVINKAMIAEYQYTLYQEIAEKLGLSREQHMANKFFDCVNKYSKKPCVDYLKDFLGDSENTRSESKTGINPTKIIQLMEIVPEIKPVIQSLDKLERLTDISPPRSQKAINAYHHICNKRIKESQKQLTRLQRVNFSKKGLCPWHGIISRRKNINKLQNINQYFGAFFKNGLLDAYEYQWTQTVIDNKNLKGLSELGMLFSSIALITLISLHLASIAIPHLWPVTLGLTGLYFIASIDSVASPVHKMLHGRTPQLKEMFSGVVWLLSIVTTLLSHAALPFMSLPALHQSLTNPLANGYISSDFSWAFAAMSNMIQKMTPNTQITHKLNKIVSNLQAKIKNAIQKAPDKEQNPTKTTPQNENKSANDSATYNQFPNLHNNKVGSNQWFFNNNQDGFHSTYYHKPNRSSL